MATDPRFPSGVFHVILSGVPGSGKTVALKKIEAMLQKEGYQTKRSLQSENGSEHTLSVRWANDEG